MASDDIIIPIFFFFAVAVPVIIWLTSRHKERIKMIEKGLSAEDIKALYSREVHRDPLSSLKWGIIFVLGGAAILLGYTLHHSYNMEESIIPGLVVLFVGVGLVLFYMIASKKIEHH